MPSQMIYKADCENCICKICCEDVGKKKDCKYYTKFESEIMRYFGIQNGKCTNDTIEKYLRQRHEQEVRYAKQTLKMYGLALLFIAVVVVFVTAILNWHIIPLRIAFWCIVGMVVVWTLYCLFMPAFLALKTVVKKR